MDYWEKNNNKYFLGCVHWHIKLFIKLNKENEKTLTYLKNDVFYLQSF